MMSEKLAHRRPIRAKLIFNATAGRPEESPQQLAEILTEMQSHQIRPEVFTVRPNSRVGAVVSNAIRQGIRLIVVAGGDGTIHRVAGAMVGSSATLGIIPTGTRNNLAFNLGIPNPVPEAVALLRDGVRTKIDVGHLHSGRVSHWFLEAATLGLLSDLYPVADDIQHGDLAQIGNLLSTFVASIPSRLRVVLDGRNRFDTSAHMVLIANMAYIGPRFQISEDVACTDGQLDVFVFSDMGKLDLIAYAMQSTGGAVEEARLKHFRVKRLRIQSDPPMPVLADGVPCDPGPVMVRVHPRALTVMASAAATALRKQPVAPSSIGREAGEEHPT